MSELFDKKATMLKEAFPSINESVVKAVLSASKGNSEDAFHALLGMTDPKYQKEQEEQISQREQQMDSDDQQRQLLRDQQYAMRLQRAYAETERQTTHSSGTNGHSRDDYYYNDDGREPSWFDEEFPRIKQQLSVGFRETKEKVGRFINRVRARIEEDDFDYDEEQERMQSERGNGETRQQQLAYLRSREKDSSARALYNSQQKAKARGGPMGYDSDPKTIDDESLTLKINDESEPPKRPPRPISSSLLKTSSSRNHRSNAELRPETLKKADTVGKTSLWQPIDVPSQTPRSGANSEKEVTSSPFGIGEDSSESGDDIEKEAVVADKNMASKVESKTDDSKTIDDPKGRKSEDYRNGNEKGDKVSSENNLSEAATTESNSSDQRESFKSTGSDAEDDARTGKFEKQSNKLHLPKEVISGS